MLTVFTALAAAIESETDFMTVVKINDLCKAFRVVAGFLSSVYLMIIFRLICH